MYTMVLLDDEKIVLQGIQKVCEKEDCGFLVKGAFVDPLKALDALPELRPHLIITDVRMPQMDGLEFAKRAKEILPESEIVLLSGYRDFTYAQTAMKIGVSDYLLKPIKKADFSDMLHRMYARIEARSGKCRIIFRNERCRSAAGHGESGGRPVSNQNRAGCAELY